MLFLHVKEAAGPEYAVDVAMKIDIFAQDGKNPISPGVLFFMFRVMVATT